MQTIKYCRTEYTSLEDAHKAVEDRGKRNSWSTMKMAGQKAKLTREWNSQASVVRSTPSERKSGIKSSISGTSTFTIHVPDGGELIVDEGVITISGVSLIQQGKTTIWG